MSSGAWFALLPSADEGDGDDDSDQHPWSHVPGVRHGFKCFSGICFLELCDDIEGNTRDSAENEEKVSLIN